MMTSLSSLAMASNGYCGWTMAVGTNRSRQWKSKPYPFGVGALAQPGSVGDGKWEVGSGMNQGKELQSA